MKAVNIFFSGIVQGVGFRFTARSLARRYNICGWVKNLADGRVEILAQGQESDVNGFVRSVKEEFKRYIASIEINEVDVTDQLDNFDIHL